MATGPAAGRMFGRVAFIGGIVLVLVAAQWGHAGVPRSLVAFPLLLALGGAALAWVGVRLLRKPKQNEGPVQWRRPDDEA